MTSSSMKIRCAGGAYLGTVPSDKASGTVLRVSAEAYRSTGLLRVVT